MKNLFSLIVLITLCISSCEKSIKKDELANTIESELISFNNNEISDVLSKVLHDNEILIFGETHYVQEHQDLIVDLLSVLGNNGYKVILDELPHAYSWMVEDYVAGEIDQLTESILYFEETMLEGIREYNLTVDVPDRISLHFFDLNHKRSSFKYSVSEMEKIIGPIEAIKPVFEVAIDSETYIQKLGEAKGQLATQYDEFIIIWGERWYSRIQDMINVEIISSQHRTQENSQLREQTLYENIVRTKENLASGKILVNTGMFHAQKTTYMGVEIDRLGKMITSNFPSSLTIAFIGIKGETKYNYFDDNTITFNLIDQSSDDDVVRIVNDLVGKNSGYLPLNNDLFNSRNISISYTNSTNVKKPIGKQFDAIITYPTISLLKSMQKYNFN